MRINVTIIAVILGWLLISCNGKRISGSSANNTAKIEKPTDAVLIDKKIVEASVINKEGVKLNLKFDNEARTCVLYFDGDTVLLKQERMASGIKYSNEHYLYTEWHGEIRLFKDGKQVFSHDQQ